MILLKKISFFYTLFFFGEYTLQRRKKKKDHKLFVFIHHSLHIIVEALAHLINFFENLDHIIIFQFLGAVQLFYFRMFLLHMAIKAGPFSKGLATYVALEGGG